MEDWTDVKSAVTEPQPELRCFIMSFDRSRIFTTMLSDTPPETTFQLENLDDPEFRIQYGRPFIDLSGKVAFHHLLVVFCVIK